MRWLIFLIFACIYAVNADEPKISTLFKSNDGKYPCYRQVNTRESFIY